MRRINQRRRAAREVRREAHEKAVGAKSLPGIQRPKGWGWDLLWAQLGGGQVPNERRATPAPSALRAEMMRLGADSMARFYAAPGRARP